jgi:ribonuclease J
VLNAVRPRNFMPVHGEWRHLRAHGDLAVASGVPADRVVLADDGVVVDLVDGRAAITGRMDCGYVYVDGVSVGDIGATSLKDRRILRDEGFISVVAVVDSVTGKVTSGPHVFARGFSDEPGVFDDVVPLIEEALDRAAAEGIGDAQQLQQIMRRTVGKWVSDTYRRRPMIIPTVIEA